MSPVKSYKVNAKDKQRKATPFEGRLFCTLDTFCSMSAECKQLQHDLPSKVGKMCIESKMFLDPTQSDKARRKTPMVQKNTKCQLCITLNCVLNRLTKQQRMTDFY